MPAKVRTNGRARFSSYEFELKTGELSRSGIRFRLESQPAKVLEFLIEADGDLVSRQELITSLWPGEVEGNFDRRLDKAVAKLRASLSDDPAKPRYIETLKGRGYRFLDAVTFELPGSTEGGAIPSSANELPSLRLGSESDESQPNPPSSPSSRRGLFERLFSIRGFVAAACLALAVFPLAWWLHVRSVVPSHNRPVVLILGFRDVSATTKDEWVLHSVTDWLSTDLAAGGELQIVQGGETPRLRVQAAENGCGGLPANVLDAARSTFNADMIVSGNYSVTDNGASGERSSLDLCLQHTRDRKSPESMIVVGAKGDISQLVFNAGEMIRSKLGLKQLSNQSLGYLRATLPVNLMAARLYEEGTSALRHFEPEEASVLLTDAAKFEPQHAPTHAALSTAWAELGYQARSQQESVIARDLAKNLSPIQQLEYAGLADEAGNDWPAAINAYTQLLQLYPDSVEHGLKLAKVQIHASKAPLALETLRKLRDRNVAAQADPRVDLTEAAADSAISDFRGQFAASSRAEIHAKAQGSDLLVADARMEQGDADDTLDNWGEALRLWRLAGQGYESIGDRGGMADALNHQGLLAWHKDDTTTSLKLFEQAVSLSNSIGDQAGIAYSLSRMGDVHLYLDTANGADSSAAMKLFHQAETIYQATGNLAEEGNVLSLFGDEAIHRTRYEEARAFYFKSMTLSQAASDQSRIANRLQDLGIVAEFEGKNQDAERYFRQSNQVYEALGQEDRSAIVRCRLGRTLFREGHIDQGTSMQKDALARLSSIGRRMQVFQARSDLIRSEMVRNAVSAEALARENIELSRTLPQAASVGARYAFADLAEAEAKQGKLKEAREAIAQAFAPGVNSVPKDLLPALLLSRGYVSMSERDYSKANADFQRSRILTHAQGQVYLEMESRLALSETHVLQRRKTALPELSALKHEAEQLGYGIFPIKIKVFLQSLPPRNGEAQHPEV
jgi:DNA-binding winged helix-turn-helix (wHTH) protein/tetratricopeptide (TPR) repeat protein